MSIISNLDNLRQENFSYSNFILKLRLNEENHHNRQNISKTFLKSYSVLLWHKIFTFSSPQVCSANICIDILSIQLVTKKEDEERYWQMVHCNGQSVRLLWFCLQNAIGILQERNKMAVNGVRSMSHPYRFR